ncbi:MAG: hypothetical protein HRU41_19395 [Saprospiraceae bacterium]|nr:hypothetical protein [Saprospiraceae bacterium]
MRLFTPSWVILVITLYSVSNLAAQNPTRDNYGNQVTRPSKSPIAWEDSYDSHGARVAHQTVAPILSGEAADNQYAKAIKESFDPNWKNILLVTDYTGSMYKYAPQALRLHLADQSNQIVRHLVLFNDGDGKSDSDKKAGSVGGIYFVDNPSDETRLLGAIEDVVNKGAGGDTQENDLEAVLAGITRYKNASGKKPSFEYIVLIADGGAEVRDMKLLPQVKFPVHTILCRGKSQLDDYLEIAYKTKGSVSYRGDKTTFGKEDGLVIATLGDRKYKRMKKGDWR